jgi:CIC family chloride channel protein
MAFLPTLWRTLSSAFSIATGAAVGREGSMIQFSTALTAWVAERFPVRSASLSLHILCGVAAAVAAVYQAPLAGVFFATEIVLGEWPWLDVPYLALASVTGWLVSRELLDSGPLFLVSDHFALLRADLWELPLALLLGLAAPVYQALLRSLEFTSSWRLPLLWSGLAVGALSLLAPAVWGNGDVALAEALRNPALPSIGLILIVRLVATTFCVGSGTVGGVFTPTLFAGAAAGIVAAHLVGAAQPALLGVFGLSTLLAAVTHAPLMASFMAVELTGQWRLWPALLILNLLAHSVARKLSPQSLYHIATSTPTEE